MSTNPQRLTVKTFTIGPRSVILSQASDIDMTNVEEDGYVKYNFSTNSFTVETLSSANEATSTTPGYVPGLGGTTAGNAVTYSQLLAAQSSAAADVDAVAADLDTHLDDLQNPHSVTKTQVGLSNVPNLDTSTSANITDSADKRFVTDAEKTRLSRTVTGTSNQIDVANGDGLNGPPTLSLSETLNLSTVNISGVITSSAARLVKTNVITSNTTLNATHHYVICNSTSALVVTLPAASSCASRVYSIKNKNSGSVTVNAASLGNIDGAATAVISQYAAITVLSDGTTWNIV